jgi:hypothetical protein
MEATEASSSVAFLRLVVCLLASWNGGKTTCAPLSSKVHTLNRFTVIFPVDFLKKSSALFFVLKSRQLTAISSNRHVRTVKDRDRHHLASSTTSFFSRRAEILFHVGFLPKCVRVITSEM